MSEDECHERLSSITTMWTALRDAHEGQRGEVSEAHQVLVRRYGDAVYQYLLAAVREPHIAEDLAQEFALRLIRGKFRAAAPERGRFRNYVKTVLFHMLQATANSVHTSRLQDMSLWSRQKMWIGSLRKVGVTVCWSVRGARCPQRITRSTRYCGTAPTTRI